MRWTSLLVLFFVLASTAAFAQDRGTVTGTIGDATGAVLPGVSIVATNTQTSARYETNSTETGNYTISQLPAAVYEISAELPGFKRYVRQGITVLVAQTLRIDIPLEVGAPTDEVTITADAPLLRTEGGDMSTSVGTDRLSELPILRTGISGAGNQGIRNPLAVATLIPGATFRSSDTVLINNMPVNSQRTRIEGQDSTTNFTNFATQHNQASVDAVQEVSVQTSNFSAEYGEVSGGLFNLTMKSGTNKFHGSAFDYFVNEFLNAGTPYLPLTAEGRNPRNVARSNDYGGSLGGPVTLPGYDGRNKTFFFLNLEQFQQSRVINYLTHTVPTPEYRAGDFSTLLTGRSVGTDPLGRPIMEGTLYDITTERLVNGVVVRDPFPNNRILSDRMDPVALKVQAIMPLPNRPGLASNYTPSFPATTVTTIPSFKIDHNLSARHKLSYYMQFTNLQIENAPERLSADGLPPALTTVRYQDIHSYTSRLNYDWTISPTLLAHIGVGMYRMNYKDTLPTMKLGGFDALKEYGLPGQTDKRKAPAFNGLSTAYGGMKNIGGSNNDTDKHQNKPTAVVTLNWVKNNHTYKFGGETILDQNPFGVYTGTSGSFSFSAEQTGLGRIQNLGGGFVGHPYASFLLGLVNNGTVSAPRNFTTERQNWALYAQDTWKLTPKFTLDYGLRWDYGTYFKEPWGRMPTFSPTTINPYTNTPGATIFDGHGPGRCNCQIAKNYPYAFGPRLGMAWQLAAHTVVRGGFGVTYNNIINDGVSNLNIPGTTGTTVSTPATGQPALLLKNGLPPARPWPIYDAALFPEPGQLNYNALAVDPAAGRPGRIAQWSLAVQREITPNFAVEIAYVGNRGVWLEANGMRNLNANTRERLLSSGLDITRQADFDLLRQPVNSASAIARGFGPTSKYLPYASFPTTATVAQMLRPFPQFGTIPAIWSPLGRSWYDALQIKATQRLSHGLDMSSSFSWQKELGVGVNGAATNNTFDYNNNKGLTSGSIPLRLTIAWTYRFPALNFNRVLSNVFKDWKIGGVVTYTSGVPITAPTATTQLNTVLFQGSSYANRVPNEPLYTADLNCHCYEPLKTFVLNPKAWSDPPLGEFSTGAARYSGYRTFRVPNESVSLERSFQIRERVQFSIRAEFSNIFNRKPYGSLTSTTFNATQRIDPTTGLTLAGFGRISGDLGERDTPRNGAIVARVRF